MGDSPFQTNPLSPDPSLIFELQETRPALAESHVLVSPLSLSGGPTQVIEDIGEARAQDDDAQDDEEEGKEPDERRYDDRRNQEPQAEGEAKACGGGVWSFAGSIGGHDGGRRPHSLEPPAGSHLRNYAAVGMRVDRVVSDRGRWVILPLTKTGGLAWPSMNQR